MGQFAPAVLNFITPVTAIVAAFVPSLWIAGAVGVVAAMVGVIVFSPDQPDANMMAAWLIGQAAVAVGANVIGRKAR